MWGEIAYLDWAAMWGEIVDLAVVNDMGRQCRFNGGQQCEERMQI